MSDLADIREAIAELLDGVAEIRRVERYERADIGTSNLPAASLFLLTISRPSWDTAAAPRFGPSDYQCEWRINVRLGAPLPQYEVSAQQLFESVFASIQDAVAPSGVLLTTSAATTYMSVVTAGELLIPEDATKPFVAQYTVTTITVT